MKILFIINTIRIKLPKLYISDGATGCNVLTSLVVVDDWLAGISFVELAESEL